MSASVQSPDGRVLRLDDTVLAPFEARADRTAPLPRRCFAAAHVTMLPGYAEVAHSVERPGTADEIAAHIDWEATLAFRERIDRCGMGVAEAMDTAQRFELGWDGARALIERTGALDLENGFVGAASTDQLATIPDLDALAGAMVEQVRFVRGCGSSRASLAERVTSRRSADTRSQAAPSATPCSASSPRSPALRRWPCACSTREISGGTATSWVAASGSAA